MESARVDLATDSIEVTFEDVNGDGVGDLDDVLDLGFGLAGLGSLTPAQTAALDFDADGDVDLDDVFELAFR